jgi:biopolymer transport protein TolR
MSEAKLDARQRRLVRRAVARATAEPEPGGDLQIVPLLDILVNLVSFLLVILATPLLLAQVEAQLPNVGPVGPVAWRATVVLAADGIHVRDATGAYAAGCDGSAPQRSGPTLPRLGSDFDFSGLRYCAETLARAHPGVDAITLSANPDVDVQAVLSAMDALQANGRLFPDVTIAAGVR